MAGSRHDDDASTTTERYRYDDTGPVADVDTTSPDAARSEALDPEEVRRERFGGINWGAGFFGWLVAVAVSVLLAGVVGVVSAATGTDELLIPTSTSAEIGLAAVLTAVAVLAVGYYSGGYVAGRMSRYDGLRQGVAVWLVGVVLTGGAVAAGTVFGDQYNVMSEVSLPSVPATGDAVTTAGLVLAAVLLVVTLGAAMAGGAVGRHYHTRVDKAGW